MCLIARNVGSHVAHLDRKVSDKMSREEEISVLKDLIEAGEYLLAVYNAALQKPYLNEMNDFTVMFNINQMDFTVKRYKYELEKLEGPRCAVCGETFPFGSLAASDDGKNYRHYGCKPKEGVS